MSLCVCVHLFLDVLQDPTPWVVYILTRNYICVYIYVYIHIYIYICVKCTCPQEIACALLQTMVPELEFQAQSHGLIGML